MIPRYQQLKAHILESIQAGRLRPRDRVPSEQELVRHFGVSRMTANRALRELASDGVVVRQSGVGTFVADSPSRSHALQVRNIADEIRERGHVHSARVVVMEQRRGRRRHRRAPAPAAGAAVFTPSSCISRTTCRSRSRTATSAPTPRRATLEQDFTTHHAERVPAHAWRRCRRSST